MPIVSDLAWYLCCIYTCNFLFPVIVMTHILKVHWILCFTVTFLSGPETLVIRRLAQSIVKNWSCYPLSEIGTESKVFQLKVLGWGGEGFCIMPLMDQTFLIISVFQFVFFFRKKGWCLPVGVGDSLL